MAEYGDEQENFVTRPKTGETFIYFKSINDILKDMINGTRIQWNFDSIG